jgi:hypothetical protein
MAQKCKHSTEVHIHKHIEIFAHMCMGLNMYVCRERLVISGFHI